MNMHLSLTPLISLLAGILILVMPKLLNFIIAIYLSDRLGGPLRLGTSAPHLNLHLNEPLRWSANHEP